MTEADWIAFFRRPEIPAFNAAMLEHPDADLPRLVFADWVEENCPNAAFVTALRRSIAKPETPEWVPNFSMVVRGHELRLWCGRIEVGVDCGDPEFDSEPDEFVNTAWKSGWVGRLKLRGMRDDNCSLRAMAGELGSVEWLDLFDSGVGRLNSPFRFWRELVAHGVNLTSIDVRFSVIGAHDAEVLASTTNLNGLKTIFFTANYWTTAALHVMATSRHLPEHIRAQFRRPA